MKKSYHSKMVPADEAAMTSRMSLASGVSCAAILSSRPVAALAKGRLRCQRGESRVPREQDRAVPRGVGARRFDQTEARPARQFASFDPAGDLRAGFGQLGLAPAAG